MIIREVLERSIRSVLKTDELARVPWVRIPSSLQIYIGGLTQLARVLPLQGKSHQFESDILHKRVEEIRLFLYVFMGKV